MKYGRVAAMWGLSMHEEIIVTAFSAKGYKEYGARLIESYIKSGSSFPMIVYTSEMDSLPHHPNIIHKKQEDICDLRDFLFRWRDSKQIAGCKPGPEWKPKYIQQGYNYRFDAHKFCRMVYVMWHAASMLGAHRMIWLDGDSVIRQKLPDDFFDRFLPPTAHISYLGRPAKYSETGFVAFRFPGAMPVLDEWAAMYTEDRFLDHKEWHSAYLFDRSREAKPEVRCHNLTPNGDGHVIHQCDVGKYIDHLKGSRKKRGVSPEAK